jgi:hypothetical protein
MDVVVDGEELSVADLRALVRVRQLDLAATNRRLQESEARVKRLKEKNAVIRADNVILLTYRATQGDQRERLLDLQDEVGRWRERYMNLDEQLKAAQEGASKASATARRDLGTCRGQLDAARKTVAQLQARVAELEEGAASSSSSSSSSSAPASSGSSASSGGFAVGASAARRIVQLLRRLMGVKACQACTSGDLLELGLANVAAASRDMDCCLEELRSAVEKCYDKKGPATGSWGALLAATFADVVFADDLLAKTWTESVQHLHQAAEAADRASDQAPPDISSFPLSLKAGCLLSYVRTHLPVLTRTSLPLHAGSVDARPQDRDARGKVVRHGSTKSNDAAAHPGL